MAGNKELNKYLKELTKEELIKEVHKLYGKFKFVKEYYASGIRVSRCDQGYFRHLS